MVSSVTLNSANSKQLASGGSDGVANVWDLASGTCAATLHEHCGAVYSVAFSPKGMLIYASEDGTVKVWQHAIESE